MPDQILHLPVYTLWPSDSTEGRTFYDSVIPELVDRGLSVAVVCVDVRCDCEKQQGIIHGLTYAMLGDYSDGYCKYRYTGSQEQLLPYLAVLARKFDCILLEGQRDERLTHILLHAEKPEDNNIISLKGYRQDAESAAFTIIEHLGKKLSTRPVWACILIGGKSSRMGRPKHLLEDARGRTWLERMVDTVQPFVEGIALSGQGEIPHVLGSHPRLPDVPGIAGPLTGILSAMRWQPDVSWLLLACDMPDVTTEAIQWLLCQNRPGRWGSVPTLDGQRGVEPLFARFEPQSSALFEQLAATGVRRISCISEFDQVRVVRVPAHLHNAWLNVNTPEELTRSHFVKCSQQ